MAFHISGMDNAMMDFYLQNICNAMFDGQYSAVDMLVKEAIWLTTYHPIYDLDVDIASYVLKNLHSVMDGMMKGDITNVTRDILMAHTVVKIHNAARVAFA